MSDTRGLMDTPLEVNGPPSAPAGSPLPTPVSHQLSSRSGGGGVSPGPSPGPVSIRAEELYSDPEALPRSDVIRGL